MEFQFLIEHSPFMSNQYSIKTIKHKLCLSNNQIRQEAIIITYIVQISFILTYITAVFRTNESQNFNFLERIYDTKANFFGR